uniref:RING-type E3 ubiquitin transferase n=1 Tax=Apis cerana TaxID=7461 RepID=V9IG98_APICE
MTGHHRRPHEVVLNPDQVARREQLPSIVPQVSMLERLRRRVNPADYRRNIYRLGIWATALPDVFGRFRECSADYYRREPRELNRLIPWLNRELQVLLNNNASHVAYVLRVILDALSQYDIRSPEFRDLVRPHFSTFTDHFVHELLNYARTNFDLVGYDQSVTYLPQGLSNEYVSSVLSPAPSSASTSSDDSDVRVLDEAIDLRMNTEMPNVGPHTINMPDNDCEVIGYVKPRHERTPEIIELLSSDPEEINISYIPNDNAEATAPTSYEDIAQPSTSHNINKRELTSSSNESNSDSDSDYTFRRSRKYQNRTRKHTKRSITSKRRNRSIESRVRNRTSRNLSSSGESESRKKGTKRNTQRTTKRRLSTSSDSSSHETQSKPMDEKKFVYYTPQHSAKVTVRVRKDLIKKETRYSDDESFSSNSSTESDDVKNVKSHTLRKSKRKYTTSSSDFDTGRSERIIKTRGKTRQIPDRKESHRKELRYKNDRQSLSRSSSASSYASQKVMRDNSRRRDSQRGLSDDDNNWIRDVSRKGRELKSKTREVTLSSSDFDEDYRSHSQCSNYSAKSYTYKKKSKHKDKHKSKKRKRSSSRSRNSSNRSRLTRRHPA